MNHHCQDGAPCNTVFGHLGRCLIWDGCPEKYFPLVPRSLGRALNSLPAASQSLTRVRSMALFEPSAFTPVCLNRESSASPRRHRCNRKGLVSSEETSSARVHQETRIVKQCKCWSHRRLIVHHAHHRCRVIWERQSALDPRSSSCILSASSASSFSLSQGANLAMWSCTSEMICTFAVGVCA